MFAFFWRRYFGVGNLNKLKFYLAYVLEGRTVHGVYQQHEAFSQCRTNVGSSSTTLAPH